jgi:putative ABC transport system substrate-binding protein
MGIGRLTRRRFLLGAAAMSVGTAAASAVACSNSSLNTGPLSRAPRMAMLGWLASSSAGDNSQYREALRAGLRDLGYVSGQHFVIYERYADGDQAALPDRARDLAKLRLDVIVAAGTQAAQAAVAVAESVPVVFTDSGDPLGAGLVSSLAQPGKNATGITSLNPQLAGKRIELMKTALPRIKRIVVIWADGTDADIRNTQADARTLGVEASIARVASENDVQLALQQAVALGADALVAVPTPLIGGFGAEIARFALEHGLPSISEQRDFVAAGGLMAYGANTVELFRGAAAYVAKVLEGARPAELPVERAETFELVLNFETVRRLNIVLPQSLVLQAGEVIL